MTGALVHSTGIPTVIRPTFLLMVFLLAVGAAVPYAAADPISATVAFSPGSVVQTHDAEGDRLRLPGCDQQPSLPGQPDLPARLYRLVVPADFSVSGARVTTAEYAPLSSPSGRFDFPPAQPPMPTDGAGDVQPVGPDPTVYGKDDPFPAAPVEFVSDEFTFGYRVATFLIQPFRYYPQSGRLEVLTRFEFELEGQASGVPSGVSLAVRRSAQAAAVVEHTIAALVENDGQIRQFAPPTRIELAAGCTDGSMGAAPRDGDDGTGGPRNPPRYTELWPSLEGLPVDYLIITSDELAPSFNPLADWKQAKGWNTAIRTVTAIRLRYPGVDVQESVRHFIIEAGELWGTTWVLLAGDTNQVPHRPGFYDGIHGGNPYGPTDLYYATAEGNWNANGNAIFGEYDDNVDEGIDFHVGRAPAENAAEANVFVQKVLSYEQSPPPNFVTWHLLMGTTYDCVGSPTYHWGQWCKETIKGIIAAGSDTQFIWRLYNFLTDNSTFWGDELLNHYSAMNHLQAGYHFINHCDHSGVYAMGTGSRCWGGVIGNGDASALTNAPRNGILLSLGCSPNAFDYDSISEAFMNNPNGGTVAYMGNTRTGYTSQTTQDIAFFDQVFTNHVTHLGEAFSIGRCASSGYYRRVLNLLGDPEMVVWTAEPSGMEVVHPDSVHLGAQAMTVRVQQPLIFPPVPIPGAKVCLYKKNEIFSVGTTGPDGTTVLNFTCDTGTPLRLTVTAQNRFPYQALLNVSIPELPHLYVSGYEIDDDTSVIGNSDGNDDGRPDVGETIEMPLHVTNSGGAPAAGVTVRIISETPGVTVSWDQFYVGAINPGETVVTQPFVFHIDAHLSPETLAEFRVELGNLLSVPEIDRLWFTVHAPEPAVNCNNLYDDGTGGSQGNGNGIPEGGETVAIYLEIGNVGHGAARDVSGTLTSNHPYLVVLDGQTWIGDIPAMGATSAADPLLVSIDPQWMGNETLTLVLSDYYTQRGTFTIDLLAPSAPTGLAFTSGEDWIRVTWQPVSWPDLLGYHVYRSDCPTCPFVRLDTLVQAGSSFYHDVIVAASTATRIFYYYVTAVDASGNEGPPSTVLMAWLTHPELPGWPIKLTGAAIRSAAVADVDDDGDLEIFIGALENKVYGFHHDGTEIYDIDHDPNTVSGFALLDPTGSAWGDMALGDLDRDGSLDLVCTSRGGENKVYAWTMFDNDGDDMPDPVAGWPVYLGPGNERSLSATALADADEDGWLEVVFTIENGPSGQEGQVHVIDARGFEEVNWPKYGLGDWSYATPAVGRLSSTGDIGMDIVAGGRNGNLYVWRYDGQLLPGWPVQTGAPISSSPALGDLDGDGALEILQNSNNGILWAFEANGTQVAGWEGGKQYSPSYDLAASPTLADINGDLRPEVFLTTCDGVAAWSPNGNPLPGWPVTLASSLGTEASPVVADINGDGQYEILVGFGNERVYVLRQNGTILTHWPAPAGEAVVAAPTVADLDNDGDWEVVVPAAYTVHIWDCPDPIGALKIQWGTFHHDITRTGVYQPLPTPYPLGDLNCDHEITVEDIGPFALALVDPEAYQWQWFWCDINLADTNQDTWENGLDIQSFVNLLLAP